MVREVTNRLTSGEDTMLDTSCVRRFAVGTALALAVLTMTGCGDNYRPVIAAVNPVGPAAQPTKYAVAISDPNQGAPGGTLPGLATVVDFSGDTVLITPSLGVTPQFLFMGSHGNTAYVLNHDGTVNSFPISTTLITSNVNQTTLLAGANANTIFPEGLYTYITQPGRTSVAELTGSPPTLQQEIPVGSNPIYIAGIPSAPRIYSISQGALNATGTLSGPGTASAIETTNNTVSNVLPVGVAPVYGIMTADAKRAFVVNNGSNNITAINAQQNTLDNNPAAPNGTNSTEVAGSGILQDPLAVKPIWADFAPPLSELIVANQGDGTTNGSVSIFSIPLCSAAALGTNSACDPNNPIDALTFGTLVAHIPVGKNPVMVAALQDGSQAYVINEGDSTVSVINLVTNTVIATVPLPNTPNPSFIAVTTGTPTGKVYITSNNSTTMTVLRTDTNAIQTTIPLQGTGVQVRVTAP